MKHFPQVSQQYGFSPLWTLICLPSFSWVLKPFSQSLQHNRFSPVGWCNAVEHENISPHLSGWKDPRAASALLSVSEGDETSVSLLGLCSSVSFSMSWSSNSSSSTVMCGNSGSSGSSVISGGSGSSGSSLICTSSTSSGAVICENSGSSLICRGSVSSLTLRGSGSSGSSLTSGGSCCWTGMLLQTGWVWGSGEKGKQQIMLSNQQKWLFSIPKKKYSNPQTRIGLGGLLPCH